MYGLDFKDPANEGNNDDGDGATNLEEYDFDTDPTYYEVHLTVAFEWDIDWAYRLGVVKAMTLASDFIQDVTDGYLNFRTMKVVDWDIDHPADIMFHDGTAWNSDDPIWPHAGGHITLPRTWQFFSPWDGTYGNVIAHEFGHFGMDLGDEYYDVPKHDYPWYLGLGGPPGFMDNQDWVSEMTTPIDYLLWSPPPDYGYPYHYTHHNSESCWETFFNDFANRRWFDLNHDGARDITFPMGYVAVSDASQPDMSIYGRFPIGVTLKFRW
jgi:hypothetical protein